MKSTDADVFLLSESVLDSQRTSYLQQHLPEYQLITDYGDDTAILSRYPVVSYNIVPLPSFSASLSGANDLDQLARTASRRSFVHAVLDVNSVPVNVLSVRLIAGRAKDRSLKENWKWGRYLLYAQEQEQTALLNYMRNLSGPIVFGGDLNAPPTSRIIKKFRSFSQDAYFSDHLYGNFTFRTSFPTMRLDYIFHSPELIPVASEIVQVTLSDHFPVKCEFLVPQKVSLALK